MAKTPTKILEKNRRWRERHAEQVKEINRRYYAENRERLRKEGKERAAKPETQQRRAITDKAYHVNYKRQRRREILERLGGKCVRCGFDDWRGLQIDHIHNGGTKHRQSFSNIWTYYKRILESLDMGEYQVLCANCNQIKRYEEHPED